MATFVDRVTLHVSAGKGGDGCVSVRREKFKPLGGPDGGNGGDGGDVIVRADEGVSTLLEFHRSTHQRSESGGFGKGDLRHGKKARDLTLSVPVGTVVKDGEGNQLADLTEHDSRIIVARGGQGGLGNAALASPKRKAPGFALLGTPGFEGEIHLELKTMADVALVGYPSAGKSSLISTISAARPKIADYPFTTLVPNLGVVEAGEKRYTVADVPGMIEGASSGRGLGHEFLRHVERCAALLHVIDCATLEPKRDPVSDLDMLLRELRLYEVAAGATPLVDRPQLIALNKVDVPEARELAEFVRSDFEERGYEVFLISTATHEGLSELTHALARVVEDVRAEESSQQTPPRIHLVKEAERSEPFQIRKEGGTYGTYFRILGEKPERWVQQTDFSNDEAVGYLADRLAKLGVEEALVKAGAEAGSTVVIGPGNGVVFDWEPTLSSTAELLTSPRGTDSRFEDRRRASRSERRDAYYERMDAKARARQELEDEREAGVWGEDR